MFRLCLSGKGVSTKVGPMVARVLGVLPESQGVQGQCEPANESRWQGPQHWRDVTMLQVTIPKRHLHFPLHKQPSTVRPRLRPPGSETYESVHFLIGSPLPPFIDWQLKVSARTKVQVPDVQGLIPPRLPEVCLSEACPASARREA